MIAGYEAVFLAQRGYLFPWAAVFYGIGIGVFFALRFEPMGLIWVAVGLAVACVCLALICGPVLRLLMVTGLCLAAGFTVAAWRSHHVADPVLSFSISARSKAGS